MLINLLNVLHAEVNAVGYNKFAAAINDPPEGREALAKFQAAFTELRKLPGMEELCRYYGPTILVQVLHDFLRQDEWWKR